MINDSAKRTFKKSLITLALPATFTMMAACAGDGVEITSMKKGEFSDISATTEAPMATRSSSSDGSANPLNTSTESGETQATTGFEETGVALHEKTERVVVEVAESTEETKINSEPPFDASPETAVAGFAPLIDNNKEDKQPVIESVETNINIAVNEVEAIAYPQYRVVKFKFNSAEISSSDMDKLTEHALYLNRTPKAILTVSGHADSQGDSLYNQVLSEQRAQQVADLLIQMGVRPEQVKTQAFGDDQPLDKLVAYKDNRRVELTYEEPALLSSRTKNRTK
ncbi:MAG: OmpA family protein [Gammaproteobacteria bacterium]|nr:OmpA family protein [Gammaproteobacteria bacterium]